MPNPRATVRFTGQIAKGNSDYFYEEDWEMLPRDHRKGDRWKQYEVEMEMVDGELQLRGDEDARGVLELAALSVSGWTPVSCGFGRVDFSKIDQIDEFYRWLERHPHAELVEHVPLDFEYPRCPPGVVC